MTTTATPTTTPTATPSTDDDSPVLIGPDRGTTFRASSVPTAPPIADWCHPRSDPDRWIRDVAVPAVGTARGRPLTCSTSGRSLAVTAGGLT